jgi:sec-independent protein translocase protein TatB
LPLRGPADAADRRPCSSRLPPVFNFSGSEIVFLLLLALIVLGPEKLPEAVRRFGKTYGEFKKMTTGFQTELKSALDEPMREMRETADAFKKAASFDLDADADAAAETDLDAPPAAKPETKPATSGAAPPIGSRPAGEPNIDQPIVDEPAVADKPAATGLDAVVVRDAPVQRVPPKESSAPPPFSQRNSAAAVRRGSKPDGSPTAEPAVDDAPTDAQPVDGDQGAASA